jgi:formylglycine-generating enzyme required for sulfatase activity
LKSDTKYRLVIQNGPYREQRAFSVDQGKKTVLFLAGKDIGVATAVFGPPLCETAGEEWTEPTTGMTFVCVPGGEFEMGCGGEWAGDCYDSEKPAHPVRLSGFWLGKYEVTVGEFRQFVSEAKYAGDGQNFGRCDGMSKPENMEQGDRHPAACVSWKEATAFAEWLAKNNEDGIGYRLPTEAEWEYACRNRGENVLYCGGSDIEAVAWYSGNSDGKTHEVGGKKPNGIGIYDMSGNVWEWCQDWFEEYANNQVQDPTGPNSGTNRVLRGGSWNSGAGHCRSSSRLGYGPGYRIASFGFRLAFPAGQ